MNPAMQNVIPTKRIGGTWLRFAARNAEKLHSMMVTSAKIVAYFVNAVYRTT